jgi:hypothetical protein
VGQRHSDTTLRPTTADTTTSPSPTSPYRSENVPRAGLAMVPCRRTALPGAPVHSRPRTRASRQEWGAQRWPPPSPCPGKPMSSAEPSTPTAYSSRARSTATSRRSPRHHLARPSRPGLATGRLAGAGPLRPRPFASPGTLAAGYTAVALRVAPHTHRLHGTRAAGRHGPPPRTSPVPGLRSRLPDWIGEISAATASTASKAPPTPPSAIPMNSSPAAQVY